MPTGILIDENMFDVQNSMVPITYLVVYNST